MILEISVSVIAFFVVIFVIGLLITMVQIRRTAKEAEKLMETTRHQIAPISHDLTIIVNDVKRIVGSIQNQMGMVEHGVSAIKDTIGRINHFEKVLQDRLAQPILEFATLVSAISRILKAFTDLWKKKS